MSRVKAGNKFMNTNKYPPSVTGPSKLIRYKGPNADHTKASSLTDWLFLKYDMTYKTYRQKSKHRRDELKKEYVMDTGNDPRTPYERALEDAKEYYKEIGIIYAEEDVRQRAREMVSTRM